MNQSATRLFKLYESFKYHVALGNFTQISHKKIPFGFKFVTIVLT